RPLPVHPQRPGGGLRGEQGADRRPVLVRQRLPALRRLGADGRSVPAPGVAAGGARSDPVQERPPGPASHGRSALRGGARRRAAVRRGSDRAGGGAVAGEGGLAGPQGQAGARGGGRVMAMEIARAEDLKDSKDLKDESTGGLACAFSEAAARWPERPAVHAADGCATYDELERLAAGVARRLIGVGAPADRPVLLIAEPGLRLVAAMLGVWRAGRFFVAL